MFQNIGDDSVRSILLALSVTVFFFVWLSCHEKSGYPDGGNTKKQKTSL